MGDAFIINRGNIDAPGRLPMFTYTGGFISGTATDGSGNWSIQFSSSGVFTPADDLEIEVNFLRNNQPENDEWDKMKLYSRQAYEVSSGRDATLLRIRGDSGYISGGRVTGFVRIRNAR